MSVNEVLESVESVKSVESVESVDSVDSVDSLELTNINNTNNNNQLDLNFYFKMLDNTLLCINNLKEQINLKYLEANNIIIAIDKHVSSNINNTNNTNSMIEENINTLDDLIVVAKKYGSISSVNKFGINVRTLYKLIPSLEKLKNIVGMERVKNQLVDQILTSLQNLYDDDIMFHTVIHGPPGVGKTMLAKILAEVYLNMNIINNSNNKPIFRVARRSDLLGKYLGHTAIKTQEFIDSCIGGVMFIDEVYSLGNTDKKDNFSKECIDTINQNLSEKKNFICIVAGYSKEVEECFFSYNAGLKRRFPFVYDINGYSTTEMRQIFISKILNSPKQGSNLLNKTNQWVLCENITNSMLDTLFEKNKQHITNYGGDIDNIILNIKIVHGRRIFGKLDNINYIKKRITLDDITFGIEKFIENKTKEKDSNISSMYI
jgi:SpoVK/Ycf46/Vps4 family AAA+-type ATPase